MLKTFEIIYVEDRNVWAGIDREIQMMAYYPDDGSPREEIRRKLFDTIDAQFPGMYKFEYDIEEVRGEVLAKIDHRSDEMLLGFEYEGIIFSISPKAQIRYEILDRKSNEFNYPIRINSLDDRDSITINNSAETRAFCSAAQYHVMAVVESGTQQKDIIRAMTTVEELQAYTDPR